MKKFIFNLQRCLSTVKTAPNLIEIFVNGKPVKVPSNVTLIQAISMAGIDTPRFCYHERLAVAGNCRMCLVEVEKSPKPIASCAFPLAPGMKVFTDSALVKKAREGVMEFLLANHPLDCVICDQGGECDLQDQSMAFGSDRSRTSPLYEKRAVEDKDFGPLVKTSMNRCIHCTRCVRFANEVAGMSELGTTGRGNDMQITTFVEKPLKSELSGNIIDLCPVGALTSKPYEFKARPWELKKTESIDVLDAVGSNIRVDSRGMEVMRILPRLNESINEEWISDKTRFAYDGLKFQRLMQPLVKVNNSFVPTTWEKALNLVAIKLKETDPSQVEAIAGPLVDCESMFALKTFLSSINCNRFYFDGIALKYDYLFDTNHRSSYLFNTSIERIEESDAILIIASNPKIEAPILNARIRKTWLYNDLAIGVIGDKVELTYEYEHLGSSFNCLSDLYKSAFFEKFRSAKKPMVILGESILYSPLKTEMLGMISNTLKVSNLIQDDWNGFNVIHSRASFVGGTDIGFGKTSKKNDSKFTWLLGADQVESSITENAFVVYQGHHGDYGASIADVVLPGAAYTEKEGTFVNLEGRVQQTHLAVPPPGAAKQDWEIIRALSEFCGHTLKFDDLFNLRNQMATQHPSLATLNQLPTPDLNFKSAITELAPLESKNDWSFSSLIKDYYLTDPISRASITMSKCSKELK